MLDGGSNPVPAKMVVGQSVNLSYYTVMI
jgi:hypothetical protein